MKIIYTQIRALFSALTLTQKMSMGMAALLIAGVMFHALFTAQDAVDQVTRSAVPAMAAAYEMEINSTEIGLKVLKYLHAASPALRAEVLDDMRDFEVFQQHYATLARTGEERELSQKAQALFAHYRVLGLRLLDDTDARHTRIDSVFASPEPVNDLAQFLALRVELNVLLDTGIQQFATLRLVAAQQNAHATYVAALYWLVTMVIFSVVLLLFITLGFARAVRRCMQQFVQGAKEFGHGNLDHRLPGLGDQAFDRAAQAFNYMAAQLQDIMVSKERLRESEEKYRTILTEMEEGYYEVDLAGNLTFCNPALAHILGYPPEELLGVNNRRFTSELTGKKIFEAFNRVYRSGESAYNIEVEVVRQDGSCRVVSASAQLMRDKNGQPVGFRGLQYDVTESRRVARDLGLESSARHELETKLINITEHEQMRIGRELHDGLGQHLTGLAYVAKALESKLAETQAAVIEDARWIVRLINEAIAQTRATSRGLYPVEGGGSGLITALRTLAVDASRMSGIDCKFLCDEVVNIADNTVANHLYRMAQEAVNNALKHSRTYRLRIDLARRQNRLRLAIHDNGSGFDKQLLCDGAGLGFYSMRHRANIIGAQLHLRVTPDRGTLVLVTLPCLPDETPA